MLNIVSDKCVALVWTSMYCLRLGLMFCLSLGALYIGAIVGAA
jgi:hypothetical protein